MIEYLDWSNTEHEHFQLGSLGRYTKIFFGQKRKQQHARGTGRWTVAGGKLCAQQAL
jgi:hypothetical protein